MRAKNSRVVLPLPGHRQSTARSALPLKQIGRRIEHIQMWGGVMLLRSIEALRHPGI
jgi:hypothetical protein